MKKTQGKVKLVRINRVRDTDIANTAAWLFDQVMAGKITSISAIVEFKKEESEITTPVTPEDEKQKVAIMVAGTSAMSPLVALRADKRLNEMLEEIAQETEEVVELREYNNE